MEFHKENIRDHRIHSYTIHVVYIAVLMLDVYTVYSVCVYLMGGPLYVIVLQIVELFIQAIPYRFNPPTPHINSEMLLV